MERDRLCQPDPTWLASGDCRFPFSQACPSTALHTVRTMRTSSRLPLVLVLFGALGQEAHAESEMSFVDLRVEGGSIAGGPGASITFVTGDLGDKSPQNVSIDQDMGIVIGVRPFASQCQVSYTAASTPVSTTSTQKNFNL